MRKPLIICREREASILQKVWKSKEAEFVAVYGRRLHHSKINDENDITI